MKLYGNGENEGFWEKAKNFLWNNKGKLVAGVGAALAVPLLYNRTFRSDDKTEILVDKMKKIEEEKRIEEMKKLEEAKLEEKRKQEIEAMKIIEEKKRLEIEEEARKQAEAFKAVNELKRENMDFKDRNNKQVFKKWTKDENDEIIPIEYTDEFIERVKSRRNIDELVDKYKEKKCYLLENGSKSCPGVIEDLRVAYPPNTLTNTKLREVIDVLTENEYADRYTPASSNEYTQELRNEYKKRHGLIKGLTRGTWLDSISG